VTYAGATYAGTTYGGATREVADSVRIRVTVRERSAILARTRGVVAGLQRAHSSQPDLARTRDLPSDS
jgi:hypothetical protein